MAQQTTLREREKREARVLSFAGLIYLGSWRMEFEEADTGPANWRLGTDTGNNLIALVPYYFYDTYLLVGT